MGDSGQGGGGLWGVAVSGGRGKRGLMCSDDASKPATESGRLDCLIRLIPSFSRRCQLIDFDKSVGWVIRVAITHR